MKKGLILAGIMVAVFLMPVAVSAKKAQAPGQLKKNQDAEQSAKSWAKGQSNCGENQGKKGKALGQIKNGSVIDLVSSSNESSKPKGCGNSGAIWTVNSPDVQQDVNHYLRGESVYLNGVNLPCDSIDYAIWTNPPNPQNGTMVASGTINLVNGEINDILIWAISTDATSGVYKVQITSCCGKKSDNFSIKKVKPCEEPEEPEEPCDEEEEENGEVAGVKDEALPAAGPSMGLLALVSLAALIASPKIRSEVLAELKK